jgi:hypothetical protein
MSEPLKLDIVDFVTREHGERFADEWLTQSFGAMTDAFVVTHVIAWPEDRDQQLLFHEIENEIAQRISDQLRNTVVDTFVRLANEILARARLG